MAGDLSMEETETQSKNGNEVLEQLDLIQKELAEVKDRYLRALADLANLKKRMTQDRTEAYERGMISVIEELLPVLDNFERAMAALETERDVDSLHEGVKLIYNQLKSTLQHRGIEPIEALGKQFDPFWHEAAGQIPSEEAEEGEVVHELQRGYKIGDRVVRPSRVAVATRPPR